MSLGEAMSSWRLGMLWRFAWFLCWIGCMTTWVWPSIYSLDGWR
jgi:hypothetical protein